jgi:hypothetical protein
LRNDGNDGEHAREHDDAHVSSQQVGWKDEDCSELEDFSFWAMKISYY